LPNPTTHFRNNPKASPFRERRKRLGQRKVCEFSCMVSLIAKVNIFEKTISSIRQLGEKFLATYDPAVSLTDECMKRLALRSGFLSNRCNVY
jgi:hypothetical protein